MSTNIIDEMSEREAKDLLNLICCKFSVGGKARNKNTILGNVENSIRRSHCLGRIEGYLTVSETEDGEEHEYSLLNWGESPKQYIQTFIKALGLQGIVVPEAACACSSMCRVDFTPEQMKAKHHIDCLHYHDVMRVVTVSHDGASYTDKDIESALLSLGDMDDDALYTVEFKQMLVRDFEALHEFTGF